MLSHVVWFFLIIKKTTFYMNYKIKKVITGMNEKWLYYV